MRKFYIFILMLLLAYVKCGYGASINLSREETELQNIGRFWQITDIHWDWDYNEDGDPNDMCHASNNTNNATGYFGNYLCDAPFTLVRSAVHAMKLIEPHPNFILWTGDNGPHTKHSQFSVIYESLKNLTAEISSSFGSDVPIIPVLGNHDTYPRDDYPPTGEKFYGQYLENGNWNDIIPKDCHEDFMRGGYFKIEVQPQINVLVLNTNLYYRNNIMGHDLKDPGGQFKWLKEILEDARDKNGKVFIVAHSPPGTWERNPGMPFLNDTYNDLYVDMLNEYGEQIIAHIYGHEHTDSFKLFGTSHDDVKSVGFLAPSITPWHPAKLDGGTAINPSVRLYNYSSSCVTDYVQYHLNLTDANQSKLSNSCTIETNTEVECSEMSKNLWKQYYTATNTFGVKVLDVEGMKKVFKSLSTNDTYFQEYYTRNSAGVYNGYCNDTCKKIQLCAISHMKAESLRDCLASHSFIFDWFNSKMIMLGCLGSIFGLTLIIIVYVLVLPRKAKNKKSGPEYDFMKNNKNGYKPLNTVEGD